MSSLQIKHTAEDLRSGLGNVSLTIPLILVDLMGMSMVPMSVSVAVRMPVAMSMALA